MTEQPKAIAFDLDGTLAISKQPMTHEMGALLAQLLAIMPVSLAAAGSMTQIQTQFLPALPETANLKNLYLFPTNSSQCFLFNENSWEATYNYALTDTERINIRTAVEEGLDEVGLSDPPATTWGERLEDRGSQFSFSPLGQYAPVLEKERWREEHEPLRQKLRSILAEKLPGFSVATGGMTTIDITRKGITKAYGVERFSELTQIPISEMLYVGDALEPGGNDAVVKETGIPTHEVKSPDDTAALIAIVLKNVA